MGRCEDRTGELCSICEECPWPRCLPGPRPYPDKSRLPEFHYLPADKTPIENREVDDYQPRVQLTKLYQAKIITSDNADAVDKFSVEYIVDKKYVISYLQHLELLALKKRKRAAKRQKRNIRPRTADAAQCLREEESPSEHESSSEDETSEEEEVITLIGNEDSSSDSSSESEAPAVFMRTRSGRSTTTYRNRKFFGDTDSE